MKIGVLIMEVQFALTYDGYTSTIFPERLMPSVDIFRLDN
jgi:hypothetical protein